MLLYYLQEPIIHKILTYRYNISQLWQATLADSCCKTRSKYSGWYV